MMLILQILPNLPLKSKGDLDRLMEQGDEIPVSPSSTGYLYSIIWNDIEIFGWHEMSD